MKNLLIYTFIIWCLMKILIAGAFIQKWKMQSKINFENIPKVAPIEEVQFAFMCFFLGLAGIFFVIYKENRTG